MKKSLSIIAVFLLLGTMAPQAQAFDGFVPSGGSNAAGRLYYSIGSNTATIVCPGTDWSSYTAFMPAGDIVIPASITHQGTDYPVTSIGGSAFKNDSNLTSVTLPNCITSIEGGAFYMCTNLTTVSAIDSINVSSIGESAFYLCTDLTTVPVFYKLNNIGNSAFYNCTSLTSFYVADHATGSWDEFRIGDNAFKNDSSLTTVTFDLYVRTIGQDAFYNCPHLNEMVIGGFSNSSYIYQRAFWTYNRNFSSLTIGSKTDWQGWSGAPNIYIYDEYWVPFTYGIIIHIPCGYYEGTVSGEYTYNYYHKWQLFNNSYMMWCYENGSWNYYRMWNRWGSFMVREEEVDNYLGAWPNDFAAGEVGVAFHGYQYYSNALPYPASCSDSNVTIQAYAADGYSFDHWSIYSDENVPPEHFSYVNPLTFKLTEGCYMVAVFLRNGCASFDTLYAWTADTAMGYAFVNEWGRMYMEASHGDSATFRAQAKEGYHFVRWDDNNTENPRRVLVDGNASHIAYFEAGSPIETYIVTVSVNDETMGTATVNGEASATVDDGTTVTLVATANDGYRFVCWNDNDTHTVRTVTVTGNMNFTATFVANSTETYTVSVDVNDPTMGTATVNGSAAATVISGNTVTITAAANDGYRFVRWNDNDTHAVRTITVTENATYTAYFESTTQGIADVDESNITVYVENGQIKVLGSNEEPVKVFNMRGQQMNNNALPTGVYMVKVGNYPAHKVVVIR